MKLGTRYLAVVLVVMMVLTCLVSFGPTIVSAEGGNEYYVSPDGDNANPGTIDKPWKTIYHASRNGNLKPGDTVYVREGTYAGDCFWSYASGTGDNPITLKAYPGEVPVITGSGMWSQVINFNKDTRYWIIDGITTDQTSQTLPVYMSDTSHITLRNCTFKNNAGNASTMIQLNKCSYITIEGCTIDTTGGDLIGGAGEGDGIYVNGSNHILIQGNYFTRCGHYALDLKDYNDGGKTTSYNCVVRNNLIEQHWSGGIGLIFKAHHNVIENNRIYYVGEGCTYPKTGIQLAADKNIIRNNIIGWSSDGGSSTVGSISNPISILAYRYAPCDQNATDNRLYNNVTYKNGGKSLMVSEKHETYITGNKILNNIFYSDKVGGTQEPWWPAGNWYMLVETYHSTTYTEWQSNFPRNNYFYNNIFKHDDDTDQDYTGIPMFYFDGGKDGSKSWGKTLAQVQTSYPTYFFGNKEQNPKFVNADNGDFRLKSDSPAIDAGAHLTITAESGSNTTAVKVEDALFFTDGYGIVEGDKVKIGSSAPVSITSVNYDTNTLTVSTPVTYSKGTTVDLPYNGTAPDLGAVEYDANSTPMPTLGPTPVVTASPTPGPTIVPTAAPTATPEPTPKDTVAPKAPVVNPVDDNDTAVRGEAEAGATVVVKKGNTILGSIKAKSNGSFSVKIKKQGAGTSLKVTAEDAAGNQSKAVSITVKDKTAPPIPSVNTIKSTSGTVTGKAEAGAKITVNKGKSIIGSAYAKASGSYSVTIPKQKKGTVLQITAKDKAGNASNERKVTVK